MPALASKLANACMGKLGLVLSHGGEPLLQYTIVFNFLPWLPAANNHSARLAVCSSLHA